MSAELDRKRWATLSARAAMAGIILRHVETEGDGDQFVVTKWALTRHFYDLDSVDQWLDLVTGGKS